MSWDEHQWITATENQAKSNVQIQVTPEFASTVTNRLRPYKNFPVTMRPALEKVADYVRLTMIPETFRQEGPGWASLAPRTRSERAYQGYAPSHPILIRTRDLYRELTEKSHPKHVEIIKTGKDARIVIGGSSDKFKQNQQGVPGQGLPARPMLPFTQGRTRGDEAHKRKIINIMQKEIQNSIQMRTEAGGG